ncbi:MAG: hypothetical protein M1831_005901 [Alyxoria varia]|nr:MAG: hypothetical protein M1831_005901 [Alyxoria varia]
MRSTLFVSLATLAVAQMDNQDSGSDSSVSIPPYSNPNTQYLTQTNSRGVVTGQPTDIPAVATYIPEAATSPAGSNLPEPSDVVDSIYGNPRSTGPGSSGSPALPTGSALSALSSVLSGATASNTRMGGATPTASGGMGGSTPGSTPGSDSGSDSSSGSSGSSTSSSSGSSESGAAPALQVGTGLLGAVGVVFAAFL